jgi:hypothetical protein
MHAVATQIEAVAEHALVLVTWRDAFFDFERDADAHERADYLVRTVGFLLGRGPRFVTLAQEVLPDGEGYRAVTHVPVSVVERIEHLLASGDDPE